MLARVLSAAVNDIEAFPVEVEVNSGWCDTVVVLIMSVSPIFANRHFPLVSMLLLLVIKLFRPESVEMLKTCDCQTTVQRAFSLMFQ